jgi:hypothetical protein
MNPQKGQQVRCVLRNNLIIDGVVESWTDNKSVLRAKDGSSVSVIQHTDQDVVIVKILLKESSQGTHELENQFEKELEKPSDDNLRLKNLADLKCMMIEQEKKIIANKLREHHIGEVKKVTYGQPGFLKTK